MRPTFGELAERLADLVLAAFQRDDGAAMLAFGSNAAAHLARDIRVARSVGAVCPLCDKPIAPNDGGAPGSAEVKAHASCVRQFRGGG